MGSAGGAEVCMELSGRGENITFCITAEELLTLGLW